MTKITRIESNNRMSQGVAYGDMIWLAGQVGNPNESVEAQTTTILANIDRLLAELGSDKSRILSAQIWLADMANFAQMNAVWDKWVDQANPPARATGEAKLATSEYGVEIIITAVKK